MHRWPRGAPVGARSCAAVLLLVLGACTGKSEPAATPWIDTAPFSEAVPPSTYVPKVKTLLTGLPATDAEVRAVTASPAALRGLVDDWMRLPQFEGRMQDFFRTAFQQDRVNLADVSSSLDIPDFYVPWQDRARLQRTLMDSFPRTAWALVQAGRPFNETVTTRRYMMTTAMMVLLSYADMFGVDDAGDRTYRLGEVTSQQLVLDPLAVSTSGAPLTADQSVARFGRGRAGPWTWRIPVQNLTAACQQELRTRRGTAAAPGVDPAYGIVTPAWWDATQALFGVVFGATDFDPDPAGTCVQRDGRNVVTALLRDDATAHDWDDWRMVTVEQLPLTEPGALPSPVFWDLTGLRAASTLKLKSPRLGFFGTLAWAANWPTNESNQARVTANQALIVALGLSIIPAAAVAPAPVTASDSAHSTDPACAACHKVLDPLRQFFRQSYTFSYHEQRDLGQYLGNAAFLLGGMNQTGTGVEDLADILARHPHFALGWAQKLQFWATSNPALETDPELQRIASAFQASGFDFRALVREVFTSPLVTLASGSRTYREQGVTVGIARRDQLCTALSARLGLEDACHQRSWDAQWSPINQAGQMIATDTYYRAAELPALPRNPDLFFRDSVEAICERLAYDVVDAGTGSLYTSETTAAVAEAITGMVTTVMGLPPADPRATPATLILREHYDGARAANVWRVDALRSTFVLACSSPSSVMLGL